MKTILLILSFITIYSIVLQGIDVSSYQGYIDWSKVAASKHFAILRSGTGYHGKDNKDYSSVGMATTCLPIRKLSKCCILRPTRLPCSVP